MHSDERQGKLAEAPNTFHSGECDRDEPMSSSPPMGTVDSSLAAPEKIRISAWMYVRTIFLMAWSAFRHPFRTTYIDMVGGEVIHIRPGEETWE